MTVSVPALSRPPPAAAPPAPPEPPRRTRLSPCRRPRRRPLAGQGRVPLERGVGQLQSACGHIQATAGRGAAPSPCAARTAPAAHPSPAAPAFAPRAASGRVFLERGAGQFQGAVGDIEATSTGGTPRAAHTPGPAGSGRSFIGVGAHAGPAIAPRAAEGPVGGEVGLADPRLAGGDVQAAAGRGAPRLARPALDARPALTGGVADRAGAPRTAKRRVTHEPDAVGHLQRDGGDVQAAAIGGARPIAPPAGRVGGEVGLADRRPVTDVVQAAAGRGATTTPCAILASRPRSAGAEGAYPAVPAGAPRATNGHILLERGAAQLQGASGHIQATAVGGASCPATAAGPAPGRRAVPAAPAGAPAPASAAFPRSAAPVSSNVPVARYRAPPRAVPPAPPPLPGPPTR